MGRWLHFSSSEKYKNMTIGLSERLQREQVWEARKQSPGNGQLAASLAAEGLREGAARL